MRAKCESYSPNLRIEIAVPLASVLRRLPDTPQCTHGLHLVWPEQQIHGSDDFVRSSECARRHAWGWPEGRQPCGSCRLVSVNMPPRLAVVRSGRARPTREQQLACGMGVRRAGRLQRGVQGWRPHIHSGVDFKP
ncbi:hypothetical protein T492DRAFT_178870 [Pavlovales sp. CCMP2436]|nr:hypothetical protein T492DRAFT_178870 [Pavlovales sp. CCMP2436]